jgi:EpsI family protein
VAEACSGVKFLVAMVAYGALVANLCFRSWARRIVFMAVSVVVPILANGFRAFGTIYAAHLTSEQTAVGFDHVVYGWFFFAFVMALVMAIGWRFFDRGVFDPWLDTLTQEKSARRSRPLIMAFLALLFLLVPLGWNFGVSAAGRVNMPNAITFPAIAGWTRTPSPEKIAWSPHFSGANHNIQGHFSNTDGDQVDLAIVLFAWQEEGRELIGYGQGAVDAAGQWSWSADAVDANDGMAERLVAPGPVNREVVSFYVVGDQMTGTARDVKLQTLKARLLGRDQAAAAILISAVDTENRPARAAIDRFIAAMGAPQSIVQPLIKKAQAR